MSTAFEDIRLEWGGKTYVIKARRRMGAIARIEDIITLPELQRDVARGGAPLGKLSMAYGAVLRFAGATVTDEEVFIGMYGAGAATSPEDVLESISTLLQMMLPPAPAGEAKPAAGEPAKAGEPAAGNVQPAAIEGS